MTVFRIGDEVRKVQGYPFEGKIVAVYDSVDEDKYCVRHKDGWDHIFHGKQLAPHSEEYQYLDLLRELLAKADGDVREDRTGVGTYSKFGHQFRFDLSKGFPLLTTKRVPFGVMAAELVWFLRGLTNVDFLHERNCRIWDEWADEDGNLGPVYGHQWRSWDLQFSTGKSIDQIAEVIKSLRDKPNDRGHIVNAWNVADLKHMALRPCHVMFQFYVADGRLSCHLYQRSADIFLGVPFNIASYALLTHIIAKEVGLGVGDFVHSFGDVHLYSNHTEQAREQLARAPHPFPKVSLSPAKKFDTFDVHDFALVDYRYHPTIAAPVAV